MTVLKPLLHALALFGLLCANANAALVLDNTAAATATLQNPSASSSLATGPGGWVFSVSGAPYSVSDIVFGFYANSTGQSNLGVRLFSGSSTSGTALEDTGLGSYNLDTIANGGSYITWGGLDWSLAAGTYTLAAYGSSITTTPRLAVTSASLNAGGGITALNALKGSSTSSDNYAIYVQGVSSSVPEPSAIALLMAGVLGFIASSARRRRSGHSYPG